MLVRQPPSSPGLTPPKARSATGDEMMTGCLRITLCALICCALFLTPEEWPFAADLWEIPQSVNAMTPLTTIAFRNRVVVSGQRVTLLELCDAETLPEDWKAYMAGIDIGPAPEPSSSKVINLQNLRAYFRQLMESQGLKPDLVTLQLPERITVERRKKVISKTQIEEIVRGHILNGVPVKPEDVAIQIAGLEELPVLPDGALTWEILTPFHDPAAGTTTLTIQFYVDGNKAQSVRVISKVQVFQQVVRASRTLKRNEVINTEDIQQFRTDVAQHPERFITDVDQVIGKRLVSEVAKNQPIGTQMLDKAITMKRGTSVVIVYQQAGLKFTAKGQAKEDASMGDRVRITNTDSKKTLSCRVVDPHTVELIP
jgi:flagella basal body P-ring formation protein FlgA